MIAKANDVMDIFYLNEKERAAYQAAWRYESDRVSMLKETEEKALAKGIEKGIEKGIKEGKINTARQMKKANCEISFIMEMTGLSKEEIAKL